MFFREQDGPTPLLARACWRERKGAFETFRTQPETRVRSGEDFFIWIGRNPLKSPDSAKRIQGNQSDFIWFCLVLLGFIWTDFASRLH
jgi:hypothetical protein